MLESKKDEREGLQPLKNVSGLVVNEEGAGTLNNKNNVHIVDDPEVDWKS